jgi:cytochrome c peroxidase
VFLITHRFFETSEDLFEVFKSIFDEFSSDKEENLESYPEKGKHLFYREEMHDVLH